MSLNRLREFVTLLRPEFDYSLGTVTKRFVLRFATATERQAISNLISKAVRRFNGNAAAQPDGPAALLRAIYGETD